MTADRPARSSPCCQALYFKDLVRIQLSTGLPERCLTHPLIIAPCRRTCHTGFCATQPAELNRVNLRQPAPHGCAGLACRDDRSGQ